MKAKSIVSSILLLLVVLAGVGVYAQGPKDLVVSISHGFSIGDKSFAAGEYRVTRRDNNAPMLYLRAEGTRESTALPVITRISRQRDSRSEANLVFDKLGEQYVLSEIWMAGEDGYLVTSKAPQPQTVAKD